MTQLPNAVGSMGRRWRWLAGAASAISVAALACSGDGPVAVPDFDPTRSTLALAAGPYQAGQSYAATLTARNTDGEPHTGPLSVVLTLIGGTSGGTFSAVAHAGGGVHTASFAATTAGTAVQVRATVNGTGQLTSAQSFSVVPGPVSASASTLTTSAATVAFGSAATLTVTARDALGNLRTAGGDAVVLGKGAGSSDGQLSPVTDLANGTYTATFTGTAAGTPRTITASVGGVPLSSTLPAITVLPPPPSPAHSVLTVGRATIASGDTTLVTLSLRDATGAPLTTAGVAVGFGLGAGSSTGTLSAVTDRGDGTYTAVFSAVLAGAPRALSATIGGAPVTTAAPAITVTPGAASAAHSAVTVGADALDAGAGTTLTLIARDAAGNRQAAGGLAVAFTKGPGTSDGDLSAVTDAGDGSYTATFTATTVGTPRTIGATVGGAPVGGTLPAITVRPGALSLAHTTLTTAATVLASGASTVLTVTARDAQGNALTGGGATVTLVKGSGTSDGTITAVTDQGNGTYTATFSATLAGTARNIGATVGGQPLTTPPVAITVTPGAPSAATSTIALSRSSLLLGDTATLTLTTRDAAGNLVAAGGATVGFTKGAGTSDATIDPTVDRGDGTYTARLTATVAGSARALGAILDGAAVTTAAASLTVTSVPPSLALSTVTVASPSIAAGTGTTVTLTVRDATGAVIGGGGLAVAFTLGAGSSTGALSAVADQGDGTYTATFTGLLAGTAREIGATIGGQPVTSPPPTITVVPGPPSAARSTLAVAASSLAAGSSTTITLVTRDAEGNACTTGGATVAFALGTGTSDGTLSAVIDHGDGTYTASFAATTVGTPRTVSATLAGTLLTTALPSIVVTPGPLSLLTSTVTVGAASVAAGATTTVTLTTRDAFGNRRTTGGSTVLFALGDGTSDGAFSPATDADDGTYVATFTAATAGTPRAVLATIDGQPVTGAAPTITVVAGAISPAQSVVTVGAPLLASGDSTLVTLTARDAAGNALGAGGATVAFVHGDGTSGGTLSAVSDQGDGRYTARFVATIAGTARSIGATIDGVAVTTPAPAVTVTPGAVSLATSTVEVGASTLASGNTTTLTLVARDAAGNALATGGLAVAFTKGAGTSDGTISPVTDETDGRYTATFTATTAGTARAVGATIGGLAVTTPAPTIAVTPGPPSLAASSVEASATDLRSGDSTLVTVTVRDAAGNALPGGGHAVAFTKGGGTSDGDFSAVTAVGDGRYTARFTGTTAGTPRTIGATVDGAPITGGAPLALTVRPGPISAAQSLLTAGRDTVVAGDTTTLTLAARDAAGNPIPTGGDTVAFTKGSGASDGTIGAVSDLGDGTYRAVFTALVAGTARSFGATVNGVAGTMAAPTVVVRPGRFSRQHSRMSVGRDTVRAGDPLQVTLVTRDSLGNALDRGGLTARFRLLPTSAPVVVDQCSLQVPPPLLDNGDGTYRGSPADQPILSATVPHDFRLWVAGEPGYDENCTTLPIGDTLVVVPGRGRTSMSSTAASTFLLRVGESMQLEATVRDAYGNLTRGGDTVSFVLDTAAVLGTFSSVVDQGDGRYTATFAATVPAPGVRFRAVVNGDAAAMGQPSGEVALLALAPRMALATDSVGLAAQQGGPSAPLLVAVANIGGGSIAGLSATSTHVAGPAACASQAWLAAPTFDKDGVADPVSVMTLQANATGLELGTCLRRVVISSTTPAVAPETLLVSLDVGRSAVATGVVNVVMMGNASSNTVQTITPTPVLRIDNAGRGTVNNLTATIVSQSGYAECVDPFDEATCVPWLAPADLTFSSPTLPATLSINSQVRPFSATARVRVAGNGMAARDFDINVVFNVLPAMVTNPRGAMLRGLISPHWSTQLAYAADTVIAFNQNTAHPGLTNYRLDPSTALRPGWEVLVTPVGNTARVILRAPMSYYDRDTVITSTDQFSYALPDDGGTVLRTGEIRLLADCTDPDDCYDFGADSVVPKSYAMPWTLSVARGMSVPQNTYDIFAADTTPIVVDVPVTNLGPGALTDLGLEVQTGHGFVTAALVDGATSTPAVVRLTFRPSQLPAALRSSAQVRIHGQSAYPDANGYAQSIELYFTVHRLFP